MLRSGLRSTARAWGARAYHAGLRPSLAAPSVARPLALARTRVWHAPVRHSSSGNSKAPKGFGNFSKKGAKGKKADAAASEASEAAEGAKAEPKAESSETAGGKSEKKSSKSEGSSSESSESGSANAKKATGGLGGSMMDQLKGMFPEGKNAQTLVALLAGAGALSLLMLAGPGDGDSPKGQTKEITFVDFCSQLVETGQVEKVVVANGTHAYVYMRTADAGSDAPGEAKYHFTIGSVDAFERRMEDVQRQLKIDTFEFIPVSYRQEVSVLAEAARFLPVILMICFFAYMVRICNILPCLFHCFSVHI